MGLMTINVGWAIISLKTKIHLWFALSSVLVFLSSRLSTRSYCTQAFVQEFWV